MALTSADTAGYNAPKNAYSLLPFLAGIGGLGISAFQTARAKKQLESLNRPQAPQPIRSQELSNRIMMAEREAQLGNPLLARERQAASARGMELARQNAAQMGGASYAALMQNAALGSANQQRQGLIQDEGLRMQRQGMLDNLIAQRIGENQMANQMAMGAFNANMQDYMANRNMAAGDMRQGLTNLSAATAALGADMPDYLSQWRDYRSGKRMAKQEEARAIRRGLLEQEAKTRRLNLVPSSFMGPLAPGQEYYQSLGEIDYTQEGPYGERSTIFDLDKITPRLPKKK